MRERERETHTHRQRQTDRDGRVKLTDKLCIEGDLTLFENWHVLSIYLLEHFLTN